MPNGHPTHLLIPLRAYRIPHLLLAVRDSTATPAFLPPMEYWNSSSLVANLAYIIEALRLLHYPPRLPQPCLFLPFPLILPILLGAAHSVAYTSVSTCSILVRAGGLSVLVAPLLQIVRMALPPTTVLPAPPGLFSLTRIPLGPMRLPSLPFSPPSIRPCSC